MKEHEFDAAREWRSFGVQDGLTLERVATLSLALWGRTTEDLRRQLTAQHPRIPSGCSVTDLQHLLSQALAMLSAFRKDDKGHIFLDRMFKPELIKIGSESFTILEARYEVARRAIEWLENRGGGTSSQGH